MARDEHDREDLLAQATALVDRAEIRLLSGSIVVVGFRRDGAASVYFDAEPVYHFNSRCELRRAHDSGRLIKAEHGRLVGLVRERTEHQVWLVRHELTPKEQESFLLNMQHRLQELRVAIESNGYESVTCVPPDGGCLARIAAWLSQLGTPAISASPGACRG